MTSRRSKRLTYTIREVSQITALKPYVLRFWETEFEGLRPKKDRNGNRLYRLEDIKLVFLIKRLLYEEKYTIEGARQRLKTLHKSGQQMNLSFDQLRREDAIFELRKGLQAILEIMNHSREPEPASPPSSSSGERPRTAKEAGARTQTASLPGVEPLPSGSAAQGS